MAGALKLAVGTLGDFISKMKGRGCARQGLGLGTTRCVPARRASPLHARAQEQPRGSRDSGGALGGPRVQLLNSHSSSRQIYGVPEGEVSAQAFKE